MSCTEKAADIEVLKRHESSHLFQDIPVGLSSLKHIRNTKASNRNAIDY